MLRFFQPMMFEQACELRIQILVVLHALDIVSQGHPLDVENRKRHSQSAMREHKLCHVHRRADEFTLTAETLLELLTKTFKEMNVLGFLAGESEQSPDPVVVAGKLRPSMIHHVGENEFLNEPKHGEVFMAADLVEGYLFRRSQKRKAIDLRQGLRQEGLCEIKLFLPPDNIFHFPVDPARSRQRRFIRVIMLHPLSLL